MNQVSIETARRLQKTTKQLNRAAKELVEYEHNDESVVSAARLYAEAHKQHSEALFDAQKELGGDLE